MNSDSLTQDEISTILTYFPKGLVVIDLETTGLSPLVDKVIEISGIKVTPSSVCFFDQLVNPQIDIPPATIEIHGIKNNDVADKQPIEVILPEFLNFVEDLPIMAHNAKFDLGFILFDVHQQNLQIKNDIYCSIKLSRFCFPDMPNHKLSTLTKELQIPLENHHRALDDAKASLILVAKGLKKYIESSQKQKDKLLRESFVFNTADYEEKNLEIPNHLSKLIKKVEGQQIVDIKYKGGSYKNQFRPIKPVSLLPMPEGNVLYAHCLLSDIYKSFSLKKISELKELNAQEIQERLLALEKLKEKG